MKTNVLGWDVGGAHLKAVLVSARGKVLQAIQVPCPLWRGLNELHDAIDQVLGKLDQQPDQHAITMTGELADIFPDRNNGVLQIAESMASHLQGELHFYAARAGLIGTSDVPLHTAAIASANWLASAEFMAGRVESGLLIDIGSTTADLILLHAGQPQNRGFTDAERLQFEELVYTGVVRTPVMSLAECVPFNGDWQPLAAEFFAATADVYRLTGDLDEASDMADTADGMAKTITDSARRLARMIGRDLSDAPPGAWIGLARGIKQLQINRLKNAAMRNFSRNLSDPQPVIIGAGCGSFLAAELAKQLNCEYREASSLIQANTPEMLRWASICLPAYAVACMAAAEQ